MAKALYGHLSAADPRLIAEIGRLRARVSELESLVEHLEVERQMLTITLEPGRDAHLVHVGA
jgi:hypothetical protein